MNEIEKSIKKEVSAKIHSFRCNVENFLLEDTSKISPIQYQCIANIFITNTWNYFGKAIKDNKEKYPNIDLYSSSRLFIKKAMLKKEIFMPCLKQDNIQKEHFIQNSRIFIINLVKFVEEFQLI